MGASTISNRHGPFSIYNTSQLYISIDEMFAQQESQGRESQIEEGGEREGMAQGREERERERRRRRRRGRVSPSHPPDSSPAQMSAAQLMTGSVPFQTGSQEDTIFSRSVSCHPQSGTALLLVLHSP